MVFGVNNEKGIRLNGFTPEVVDVANYSLNDLWIHDETDQVKASILVRFFDTHQNDNSLPRPFGIFYTSNRKCYEDEMAEQLDAAIELKGHGKLNDLIRGKNTWEIK